jgi:hypothetical protein
MAQQKLTLRPGVNTQASQTLGEGGWYASNLIRWRDGFLEKVAGWLRLFSTTCAGLVRGMHAWSGLTGDEYLMIGSTDSLQLWDGTTLHTVRAPIAVENVASLSIVGTAATSIIRVTYASHGLSTGDIITPPLPLAFANTGGGYTIYPGSTYSVTVTGTNTYSFDTGVVSASNVTQANVPQYAATASSATIQVICRGHGKTTGDPWTIYRTTVVGGIQLQTGAYTCTVIDANNLTFTYDTQATSTDAAFEGNYTTTVPIQPTAATFPATTNWFIDNFGENGVFCYENGPLSLWVPPPISGTNVATLIPTGPTANGMILVAMPQAQVVSLRAEVSGVQDPLLIRWSDVGSTSIWTASATNQAGSYHLARGSRIVGGIQAPSSTLVLTDLDLWAMQYIGPPLVYSFNIVGTGCGLIAPRAICVLNGTAYWMAGQNFYKFDGNGVIAIECPVWDVVFRNIHPDATAQNKIVAGSNSPAQEVWFFYPSADGSGEIDSYVKVNAQNGLWDYGSLTRTAWIDENVFGQPLAADSNYRIQQHEVGYDDDGTAMDGAYAETDFIDLGDGTDVLFIDQIIPDLKWFGDNGWVELTLYAKNYPGQSASKLGPFTVTRETRFIMMRKRARQIAVRVTWGTYAGFSARLGATRLRLAPSGRRP